MKNKITVIGSANTDLVIHSERMPKLGETLVGGSFQTSAGGKGLNQAIAISKLGGSVSFLGALGRDDRGDFLLSVLDEHKVTFEGIRVEDAPTGVAMITVVGGDNFIVLDAGANNALSADTVEQKKQLIADSDFCVLQLEIPVETVFKICEIAHSTDTKIVLNPAPYKELPDSVYPLVDYLIPNEHEAEAITGIHIDSEEAAREAVDVLLSKGAKNVVITLGSRGCVYSNGCDVVYHPAKKVVAVDSTSAGDCFIGALIAKLSQNYPLHEAISFATKASAITVSRPGAAASIPFEHEVK